MEVFVNRETELQLIDTSFRTLLERRLLLRTSIVEVQGVEGIGKTTLLKQVQARCHDLQLPYIWVDVEQHSTSVAREIISQVRKYTQEEDASLEYSPVSATKALLELEPVALLLDSVDTENSEQFRTIELLLRDLTDYENLFVVLISRKTLPFQQERSVARKLLTLSLQTLDRKHSEQYLQLTLGQIGQEELENIINWTRGYPLALDVVVQAIKSGVDPKTEEGQAAIFTFITEHVINQKVLTGVRQEERERYRSLLELLSVPRRFNLVVMQDLIEAFLVASKRNSSMAYFNLPKEITDATNVLNWRMELAGFSVDEPIRTIFLLLLKWQDVQRYFAIHAFLAQTNIKLARQFPGSDRVRYIRECLYHTACNTASPSMDEDMALQIILQEPLATFQPFSEEFSLDEELKEALGSHLEPIQVSIDAHLVTIKRDSVEDLGMLKQQHTARFIGHSIEIATFKRWLADPNAPEILYILDCVEDIENFGRRRQKRAHARIC